MGFSDYLLGTFDMDTGLLNPENNVFYKKGTMKKLLPMS